MVYMRLFTILLAASFMVIVFYGDLATVTALLAGLCGGFVACGGCAEQHHLQVEGS